MATSSKATNRDGKEDHLNPTTASTFSTSIDSSRNFGTSLGTAGTGQMRKRQKFSPGSPKNFGRDKRNHAKQLVGFEEEKMEPEVRKSLNVDPRFFPLAIQPGTILEIKGPTQSGKTFFLTYLIARVLVLFPDKSVVLINTRHKFSVKNLICMLWRFDANLKKFFEKEKLDTHLSDVLKLRNVASYLDRIMVFPCFSPENLLLTLGPSGVSPLQRLLFLRKDICLVAVDCIDYYSFVENHTARDVPNVMDMLKESVSETKCPVICTTIMMAMQREYRTPKNSQVTERNQDASGTCMEEDEDLEHLHNFKIDYFAFTNIFELELAPEAEINKMVHPLVSKITHCAIAYLRSKHSAKTAGSGENHRVKFSIFSDMLWVVD